MSVHRGCFRKVWLASVSVVLLLALCPPRPAAAGTLEAWGKEWGSGTLVPPSGNDFVDVDAAWYYSVAIRSDRTLAAWGNDYWGQVSTLPGGTFAAISCNDEHALGLRTDGSLAAWGTENYGRCTVPAGDHYTAVAAGYRHSVALESGGTIVAWGLGSNGQLDVPTGDDFVAIASGRYHSLALRDDGTLAAWGYNNHGQCDVPTGGGFIAVNAGDWHSLALKADGSIVVWGNDYAGILTPPAGNDFVKITSGTDHSLARRANGSLAVWGDNDYGEGVAPAGYDYLAAAGGYDHSVAIRFNPGEVVVGTATCLGDLDGFVTGGYTVVGLDGATPLPYTVDVTGLVLDGGMATLVIDYEPAEVAALGIDEATLRAYWWDVGGSQWLLAGKNSNTDQSTGQFVPGAPTGVLGDWGVDVAGDYVWANIDHASTYGVAGIPEPASAAVLLVGLLVLLRRRAGG